MFTTRLHDITPLIEIGEAWVAGLDPTVPQYVEALEGKAFWAHTKHGVPFYKVIQSRTLELTEEVTTPTCVVKWPTGEHLLYLPESYRTELPYQNRQHVTGVNDCYTLVRDFYQREMGIELPNVVATRELMESGHFDLFDTHEGRLDWEPVANPQYGDAVLFKFGDAKSPNHCGVMLRDHHFLHHFYDRLSSIDKLAGTWRKHLFTFWRHKGV